MPDLRGLAVVNRCSATPQPQSQQPQTHPFLSHLIAVFSIYELGPSPAPLPRYDGPGDWQTDSILRSLNSLARRMYTAEETLGAIKASESWKSNGPEHKKRRSVGDIPHDSSSHSPSSQAMGSSHSPPQSSNHSNNTSSGFSNSANGNPTSFFPPKVYPNSTNGSVITDNTSHSDDMNVDTSDTEDEPTPSVSHRTTAVGRTPSPMTISLDGLTSSLDTANMFAWTHNNGTSVSAPPTSHADHIMCPTCGKTITDTFTMSKITANFSGSASGSPLVVPPGPLAAAAFESGMSAVEELRLLKAQVQDVARVCNAVARGDLSQKITVPVQGVVMVQLKDVINTMVKNKNSSVKKETHD